MSRKTCSVFVIPARLAGELIACATFKRLFFPIRAFVFLMPAAPRRVTTALIRFIKAFTRAKITRLGFNLEFYDFDKFPTMRTRYLLGSLFRFVPALMGAVKLSFMPYETTKFFRTKRANFDRRQGIHPRFMTSRITKSILVFCPTI